MTWPASFYFRPAELVGTELVASIWPCKLSPLAAFSTPSKLRLGKGLRTERFEPYFVQRVASLRMPQLIYGL
jgi:hypothetical protein